MSIKFNVRYCFQQSRIFYSWNLKEQRDKNITTIKISKLLEARFNLDGETVGPNKPVFQSIEIRKGDKVEIWLQGKPKGKPTAKATILAFGIFSPDVENLLGKPDLTAKVKWEDGQEATIPLGSIDSKVEE